MVKMITEVKGDNRDVESDKSEAMDLTLFSLLMLLCADVVPRFLFLYLSQSLMTTPPRLHASTKLLKDLKTLPLRGQTDRVISMGCNPIESDISDALRRKNKIRVCLIESGHISPLLKIPNGPFRVGI